MKENSIEEDIKIVENYLANSAMNEIDSNFFKNSGWETVDLEIPKSMQHILSDYKRVLKENEELKDTNTYLQKENEELKERIREHTLLISPYYVKENFIPVQKVKDKIEELQKGPLKINENNKYYYETEAYNKIIIQVLQELLEGRK